MKSVDISVIIPLYNKERTVAAALRSAAAQSDPAQEIIVVDDGSTDGSAAEVERFMRENAEVPIKFVRQENAGVSAARNRAMTEASGEFVALLDADDSWTPDHLAQIRRVINEYPDCGIYASGFSVWDGSALTDGDTPRSEGIVDFFAESLVRYVVIPSAAVLRRQTALEEGGFPAGMRMGEDQYLWTKMARRAPVCFSPARTTIYSREADNRSAAIYRAEQTRFSFEELYDPAASDASNEYIARVALGKALVQSAKGGTEDAARAIRFFAYTRRNRRALRKVRFINALPVAWRRPVLNIYNFLAWKIARKGL